MARARLKTPGQPLDAEETSRFQNNFHAATARRRAASKACPAAITRLAKRARREPYLATYDWLCALENAMREGVGHGLSWYTNTDAGRAADDDFRDGEVGSNNILIVTVDEEQKQLRGLYFLQ